jgi:hypothetical protein
MLVVLLTLTVQHLSALSHCSLMGTARGVHVMHHCSKALLCFMANDGKMIATVS